MARVNRACCGRVLVQAIHVETLVADATQEFARLKADLVGHRIAYECLLQLYTLIVAAAPDVVQVNLCVDGVTTIKQIHLELANLGCALGVFAIHIRA